MADRRELLLRAVGAGALVAIVVTASETVGSSITGIAMLFPVTLVTIGWIMQSRYGAEQAILVMTGALIALPGFGLSIMTLYLLAENRRARCTGHLPPHVAVLGCGHSLVSSNGLALAGSKWESSLKCVRFLCSYTHVLYYSKITFKEQLSRTPLYVPKTSNPTIVVMKSAQDGA